MADDKLYMPVSGLKLEDLLNWQSTDQRNHRLHVHNQMKESKLTHKSEPVTNHAHSKCFGNVIELNDEQIALFRIGQEVYATQAKCPHAGGPLHLADIEELVPGQVCLKCPWHKWTFNIDTGCSETPMGRNLMAKTYPTRVAKDGQIFIGFDSFGPSSFGAGIDSV